MGAQDWCNASGGCGNGVAGGQCTLYSAKSNPTVVASGSNQPFLAGFLAKPQA